MFGIPIDGPTGVFCDNESVVKNTTRPESSLKKENQAIGYHKGCEATEAGTIMIAKEDGDTNVADLLTKLLPGPRLRRLSSMVMW